MPTFAALGVPEDLCDALRAHHIDDAFDIQSATIPAALAGRDVAGRAPTGSGKTLAFGIPLVANVARAQPKRPRALVLVPTRELAAQVARDLVWLGSTRGTRVHSFYGGVGFDKQIKALRRGVDIAVACPGRLADLVKRGLVQLGDVDRVVVDEADSMADMGFLPEVKRLLDQTNAKRQTLLFSATLDGAVNVLVRRYQHDPVRCDVTPDEPEANITHHHWVVDRSERVGVTAALIERSGPTIVFSRTRHGADRLCRQLDKVGVRSVAIHGARSQNQRDRALQDFTSGRVRALVATDVAARGIHVDDVACVVHFYLPADPKDYVHRSGRTGRAGSEGQVVALIAGDQRKEARKLARVLDLDVDLGSPDVESLPKGAEPARRTRPVRDLDRTRADQGHNPQGRRKPRQGGRPVGRPAAKANRSSESRGGSAKSKRTGAASGAQGNRRRDGGDGASATAGTRRYAGTGGNSRNPDGKTSRNTNGGKSRNRRGNGGRSTHAPKQRSGSSR